MADSSRNSGAGKTKFSIPSIDAIARYEKHRPKVQSTFKSRGFNEAQPSTSTGAAQEPAGTSVRARAEGSAATSSTHSAASSGTSDATRINPIADRSARTDQSIAQSSSGSSRTVSSSTTSTTNNATKTDVAAVESSLTASLAADEPSTSSTSGNREDGAGGVPRGPRVQFTSAAEFVKKRGKIGAAFADKFMMLGRAEEYKIPEAAKPATGEPSGLGSSSAAAANKAASGNSIIVNPRQRGNPILKHIRNVPWEFGDIVPDYVMGRTTCAFYLSLRYHHLNPNYIHDRLMELGHRFDLRVLLVQVDVKDPHHSVKELARMAILADCTLILAWSSEEAGRYLETYKAYENKPADALKEKVEQDHLSKMTDCLTTVKSVNRTDVITLLANYGTFEKIVGASKEELALLPGFGTQKAQRLNNSFTEPFLRKNKRRKVEDDAEEGKGKRGK